MGDFPPTANGSPALWCRSVSLSGLAPRLGVDARSLHRIALGLEDLNGIAVDEQAGARLRDALQLLQYQPVEGARALGGQVPAEGLHQFPHAGAATHQVTAVLLRGHVGDAVGGIAGELTDDLLQQVAHGHQPQHVAVLVHHQPHAPLGLLEVEQLGVERGALGDVVGFLDQALQLLRGEFTGHERLHQVARVDEAHHVVDAAAVHQRLGVGHLQQILYQLVPGLVQVDPVDLLAGDHDVLHRGLFQIQDAEQHLLVLVRDEGPSLVDDGAQLLLAQRVPPRRFRVDPQQAQQGVGEEVHQGHQRIAHFQQRRVDPCGGEGEFFRVQGGQRLGRHFREDQDHQGENARRQGDGPFTTQAHGQDGGQRRGENVDEVVAQQDQSDEPVGPFKQSLGEAGGPVSFLRQVLQAVTVEGHEGGFGTGEEGRENDEQEQRAEEAACGYVVQLVWYPG